MWEIVVIYFPDLLFLFPFLKYNYSIVCHTQPEKLFQISNFHTLVCSRCFGIYSGALLSIILILFGFYKSLGTKFLLLSSIPMFADVILYSFGFYTYSKWLAFSTGILLGSVGFFYIHSSLLSFFAKNKGVN